MKKLFFLNLFISVCFGAFAQSNKTETTVKELSFKDTNYIYIGIVNKFNLEKEKLGIVRVTDNNAGISSKLYSTYLEISPKHEGIFTVMLETSKKKFSILFLAKRVLLPE